MSITYRRALDSVTADPSGANVKGSFEIGAFGIELENLGSPSTGARRRQECGGEPAAPECLRRGCPE